MRAENKQLIEKLQKQARLYESLKADERFVEFKTSVIDDRREQLIRQALLCDLTTKEGQITAVALLIAAKEAERQNAIFEEMEHYGEETERLLNDSSEEG